LNIILAENTITESHTPRRKVFVSAGSYWSKQLWYCRTIAFESQKCRRR